MTLTQGQEHLAKPQGWRQSFTPSLLRVVYRRNFIVDLDSSDLCAFHVGTLHSQRLAREASERWRRESCPGDTHQ